MTDTAVRQKPSSFPVSALIDETSSRDESISTSQEQEQTSSSDTSRASDDDNSMDIEGEGTGGDVNGESDDKNTEVGKTDSSVTNTGRQSRKRLPKLVATELQKIFERNDTPSFDVREELGKKFGMTNREVQVWFQNKRAKLSRLTKLQSQQQLQQQNAGAAAPNSGPMLKWTKRWAPPPPIQIQTKNLSHRPIPILPSPTSSNTPLYVSSNSTKVHVAVPSYPVVPAVSQVAKQDAGISSTHSKLSIRPVVPNIVTHGKAATVAVPYYAYYPVYANHPGGVYMYPSYQNVTPISPTYVYPTQPKSVAAGAASPKSPKSKSKSPSKLSISTDTATATSPKVKSTPSIPTPILPKPSYSWPMPMPITGYPVYPSTWHRVMSAAMSTYGPTHQGAHPNTISTVPIAPVPDNSSKEVEKVAKAKNPKSISQTSTAAEDVTVQSHSSSKFSQKRTQPNNAVPSSAITQARESRTNMTEPASLSPSANSNPSPLSAVSDQVDIQDALLLVSLKHHQPQPHPHPSYNPSSSPSNKPTSRSKTSSVAAVDHISPQTKETAKVTRKRGTQSIEDGNQSTVESNKKKRKTNEPSPKKPATDSSLSSPLIPTVEATMTKTSDKIKYAITHEHETLGTEKHKSPIVSHNIGPRKSGKERRNSRSSQSQGHSQTVQAGHGKSDKKGGKFAI